MRTKLSFKEYKILSSTFSNSGEKIEGKLEVEMQPKIQIVKKESKVALNLSIYICDKSEFKLKVEGIFIFHLNCNTEDAGVLNEEEIAKELTVEAVQVAYLLLRSYISSYTALSGIMSILLPLKEGKLSKESLEKEEN